MSSVANRSEIVTVTTPRGAIEIVHQQWRSHRPDSTWEQVWLARRRGQRDWRQGTSAREALRHAALLPSGKQPAWLSEAGRVRRGRDLEHGRGRWRMKLQHVHAGGLIEVNKGGRRLVGKVLEIRDGVVQFEPLCRGFSYQHATAREIVAHWRKTGRRGTSAADDRDEPPAGVPREQLSLRIYA